MGTVQMRSAAVANKKNFFMVSHPSLTATPPLAAEDFACVQWLRREIAGKGDGYRAERRDFFRGAAGLFKFLRNFVAGGFEHENAFSAIKIHILNRFSDIKGNPIHPFLPRQHGEHAR
jgi:hypothetical protein